MIKIERILCPLDLTDDSAEALRYAVALAKSYEAKLYLCHCTDEVRLSVASCREMFICNMRDQAREHCGISNFDSIECETIIAGGNESKTIVRLASDKNIDLIVMASRRRNKMSALLGSTTESVSHLAECPVLIVHPGEREWVGKTNSEIDLRRILIAHDFSTESRLALNIGISLAQEHQAELHLMHVLPYTQAPQVSSMTAEETAAFQDAASRLYQAVPPDVFLWCDVRQAVRVGQTSEEILDYAETYDIDLICIGAQGAGFVTRTVFGSNADRVLRQAPCPVLVARPVKEPAVQQAGA